MVEIEIFVKGQNITERGPLATEGEEKRGEVNPDMDVYAETRNHRKTLRKT